MELFSIITVILTALAISVAGYSYVMYQQARRQLELYTRMLDVYEKLTIAREHAYEEALNERR